MSLPGSHFHSATETGMRHTQGRIWQLRGQLPQPWYKFPASHCELDLHEAQLADSVLGPILQNKYKGEKPGMEEIQCASWPTSRLMQLWDQLQVQGGTLYRVFESQDGKSHVRQRVILETLREEVLADMHQGIMGVVEVCLISYSVCPGNYILLGIYTAVCYLIDVRRSCLVPNSNSIPRITQWMYTSIAWWIVLCHLYKDRLVASLI